MVELKGGNKFSYIHRETFPNVFKRVGDDGQDDEFRVYIKNSVINEIDEYLASDKTKELGGVLIGNAYKTSKDIRFIHITDFIHAEHTEASVSRLTFTHKTWESIGRKLDNEYEGKIVLGWYHSHPGHSVFMSDYDVFIQKNFFDMEFMTAYVFDPVLNQRAFFYKLYDKIQKIKNFYISGDYTMANRDIENIVDDSQTVNEFYGPQPNRSGFSMAWNIVLLVLVLISLYYGYTGHRKAQELEAKTERARVIYLEVDKIRNDQNILSQRLDNFILEMRTPKTPDTLRSDTTKTP
ncbi:MAG: Mov34/MPN/PAD-1 family protein [Ignavibacteriaceae bacterium]|jgi:Mov34/MPN/PAD-1 family.|nr:MAG: Mov34/MPN/PAD-1 family protein [Chlorobi bacterium OLB4]MBW7856383.1 Mov34/MPN/PAD-1 family protein [Ignavibacteria bacterium]MEB2329474.1 Mov34/MPN/PAD-1 family protein [Ignavibacteriaceae bacterium]OQY78981.1 MAG: hypothetical protein B6D43_01250 [Ignavibacteriales bacterium UTCHB1]